MTNVSKAQRSESVTSRHVMLSVRFDPVPPKPYHSSACHFPFANHHPVRDSPMQPQSMQERRQPFHDTQDGQGEDEPHAEHEEGEEDTEHAGHPERTFERHVVQNLGQLSMSEGKSPKTEVRSAVHRGRLAIDSHQRRSRQIKLTYWKYIPSRTRWYG
jgi:hypothetical protein